MPAMNASCAPTSSACCFARGDLALAPSRADWLVGPYSRGQSLLEPLAISVPSESLTESLSPVSGGADIEEGA
jgi:hypothetical protein